MKQKILILLTLSLSSYAISATTATDLRPLLTYIFKAAYPEVKSEQRVHEIVDSTLRYEACIGANPQDDLWCARNESLRLFEKYNDLTIITDAQRLIGFFSKNRWSLRFIAEFYGTKNESKELRVLLTDFRHLSHDVDVVADHDGRIIGIPTPTARFARAIVQLFDGISCETLL